MRAAEQMNTTLVRPIAFMSIGNRSAISAAVFWIIVVTTSSSSAFGQFTGNTIWQWICHAQCAPFLTPSSLWSAMLQRTPEKIVSVACYGESQVESGVQ